MMKYTWKNILIILAFTIVFGACGSSGQSSEPSAEEAASSAVTGGDSYGSLELRRAQSNGMDLNVEELEHDGEEYGKDIKIIKTAHIYLETEAYDQDVASIKQLVTDLEGYFEFANAETTYRHDVPYHTFYAAIRVPVEKYEYAKLFLEDIGLFLSSSENQENVTGQYYDIKTRLSTKKVEEGRLLELIDQAEKVEDLIALEERLGSVRSDIELFESRLRRLDSQISYSTIYVQLDQVTTTGMQMYSTRSLAERIQEAFKSSVRATGYIIQYIVVGLSYIIIPALIIGCIFVVCYAIRKRMQGTERHKKQKEEKDSDET